MLTKQQRLIQAVQNELGHLRHKYASLAPRAILHFEVLGKVLFELEECPQDRRALAQACERYNSLIRRHASTLDLTGLEILFNALNDDYMAEFEEELYEKLSELTTAELRWLTEYSRNDKQVADLAAEVLDRRSGV